MYAFKKLISTVVVALVLILPHVTNALETPLSYDFGQVPVGSSSSAVISVSTSPTEDYLILSPRLEIGKYYEIITPIPTGGIPLSAGKTVSIEIKFTPTTTQAVYDTLIIEAGNPFIGVISEEVKLSGNDTEISIENIIAFFNTSVATGTLKGNDGSKSNDDTLAPLQKSMEQDKKGKSADSRLNAFRNMLFQAEHLIDDGDISGACGHLQSIVKKCDANNSPPDFVEGHSATDLAKMINDLRVNLGCN